MKARRDPHTRYRELLAARLDRQLSRAENRILLNHLRTCQGCQQAERDYRDQGALLRSLSTPVPPRDMWARTSTALDREVSRWTPSTPRQLRRRALTRYATSRSSAPNALITIVAVLVIVSGLAVFQYAPALRDTPRAPENNGSVAALQPTPFAVNPQQLAVITSNDTDLTVYETDVAQVCPEQAPDCFDDREFVARSVAIPKVRAQNAALSPNGGQIAVVGHNADEDVIAVVMLQTYRNHDQQSGTTDTPTPKPTEASTPSSEPTATPADSSATAVVTASSSTAAASSESPNASDGPDGQTPEAATPEPTSPATKAPDTPKPQQVPTQQERATPPPTSVPGLTVVSILDDVHSAGAPPAWSRNGETLAFSAMPADGSHGPDVYVWRQGDDVALPVTDDHSSYFASWSGRQVVASRVVGSRLETVVIDPQTLEQRPVGGPEMWLPAVDPQRSHAVAWSGDLDLSSGLPSTVSGALYLVDWSKLDPFRESGASGDDVDLTAIDPSRDPAAAPVIDWHARWSSDGLVLGVWQADSARASWGDLLVQSFDRDSGRLQTDEPIVNNKLAKRGFTLGDNRVAWVGRTADGSDTELRIRTWGDGGVGDLRIDSLQLEELVPSF